MGKLEMRRYNDLFFQEEIQVKGVSFLNLDLPPVFDDYKEELQGSVTDFLIDFNRPPLYDDYGGKELALFADLGGNDAMNFSKDQNSILGVFAIVKDKNKEDVVGLRSLQSSTTRAGFGNLDAAFVQAQSQRSGIPGFRSLLSTTVISNFQATCFSFRTGHEFKQFAKQTVGQGDSYEFQDRSCHCLVVFQAQKNTATIQGSSCLQRVFDYEFKVQVELEPEDYVQVFLLLGTVESDVKASCYSFDCDYEFELFANSIKNTFDSEEFRVQLSYSLAELQTKGCAANGLKSASLMYLFESVVHDELIRLMHGGWWGGWHKGFSKIRVLQLGIEDGLLLSSSLFLVCIILFVSMLMVLVFDSGGLKLRELRSIPLKRGRG